MARDDSADALNEVLETVVGLEIYLSKFCERNRIGNPDISNVLFQLAATKQAVRQATPPRLADLDYLLEEDQAH
ncbi:hypothetical protein RGUI_0219 [Rhodovulum sp. P5]|uniref:hypothetical protein n=1 Tax=Rhodovulum sp. P5 TaxID=1564506 RepID=UPI0009C2FF29|nr:hypothetical protein [Rhodovulum sp. P5]ARE38360.1 hypothetical protein RGUI_0219 [Rhodovulum sp. P5]